ncbi:MAG: PBSX family phage terminase large subunit [Ruminococcus sp.]|nr:PBSX family phage terminase large subunit [Ruminococcus sp.]
MQPKTKTKKTIPYNFSTKHLRYIRRCENCRINVAEGAVRAGKTVDNIIAFARALCKSRDKLHLATASTESTARTIIGDCNGFGLEHYFRGQCRWGEYEGMTALIICGKFTGYRKRIVVFVGGGKSNSYEKFRGMSFGMWIATEIDLHHEETVKEALARQAAANDPKVFWDLNPGAPKAKIYIEYIDKYARKNNEGSLKGGYNYQMFTIYDNINIPDDKREEFISQFDPDTAEYRRKINGQRSAAEGLIFQRFADTPSKYISDVLPKGLSMINIGVDFGGNMSKTTFAATGIKGNFEKLCAIADHKIKGGKGTIDAVQISRELYRFYCFVRSLYPNTPVKAVYCDHAEQAIINTIRGYFAKMGAAVSILDCYKGKITNRIYTLHSLIMLDRFEVYRDCRNIIDSLCEQVWDSKAVGGDVRLDDGTADIDTADALEYSFSSFIKYFNLKGVTDNG